MTNDTGKGRRKRNLLLALAALIVIALASVFVSGMSDKEGRIKVALALAKAREAQDAIAAYHRERKALPPDNASLRLPNKESKPYFTAFEQQAELSYGMLVRNGTLTLTFAPGQDPISGKTLVLAPTERNGALDWACNAGTVEARYRPPQCRGR